MLLTVLSDKGVVGAGCSGEDSVSEILEGLQGERDNE
jgi:hypothetical protein